jgi:beta-lactam-binding protein with PASTA domain
MKADIPMPYDIQSRTEAKPESRFSRLSSMALMIAILFVAGTLSALTAMRFAIRGREVVVPNLTGKSEEEARQALGNVGLVLRVMSKRFSDQVPEGKIVEQHPASGQRLKTTRNVKVLVSLGDRKYEVPDLVGKSLRAAQLTLGQGKLTLGNTLYAHTGEGPPSSVIYQSPAPHTKEGADPSVNILISLGPAEEYYIMPDLIGKPAELVASRARSEGFKLGKLNLRKYPGVESGVVIQQKPQAGYRLSKNDIIYLDVSQ